MKATCIATVMKDALKQEGRNLTSLAENLFHGDSRPTLAVAKPPTCHHEIDG